MRSYNTFPGVDVDIVIVTALKNTLISTNAAVTLLPLANEVAGG